VLGKVLPDLLIDRLGPRELVECLAQLLTPRTVCLFTPRETEDTEIRGHLVVFAEVIKGWDKFASREITAGAEDHDRTGVEGFTSFT
jgi:hypothetical protein